MESVPFNLARHSLSPNSSIDLVRVVPRRSPAEFSLNGPWISHDGTWVYRWRLIIESGLTLWNQQQFGQILTKK